MPRRLLNVPLRRMRYEADCLAACAAMVLDYVGRSVAYEELLQRLEIGALGAPASRLKRLHDLGVEVDYGEGTIDRLEKYIDNDQPVIVLVRTAELPHWRGGGDTFHSVVVTGYDETHFLVNDPYFDGPSITVPRGDFVLAWLEMGYRCAVIAD